MKSARGDDVERATRRTPSDTAAACGISLGAAELFLDSPTVDLHLESPSFRRALGYDLRKRHEIGIRRALLFGQADLPRILEVGLRGAFYSLTANPIRPIELGADAFRRQFAELRSELERGDRARFVRGARGYRACQDAGLHAAFLAVQGAGALGRDEYLFNELGGDLVSVGLVHLTRNAYGASSSSFVTQGREALTRRGAELIELLAERRILIDLAHIHPRAFWAALDVTPQGGIPIVSHTGVSGAHTMWRNIDDRALRAIADRGGMIGIIFHSLYLGDGLLSGTLERLVDHIEHAVRVVGPEHVALGSDFDGLICPPRDMPTCLELPRLVQAMLDRRFEERKIRGILGENALRVLTELRPED